MNVTNRLTNRLAPVQLHLADASAGVASLLPAERWQEQVFQGCHQGIECQQASSPDMPAVETHLT